MPAADDVVWLDVLPSMQKFGPALAKGAGEEADKAGKAAGGKFGKAALAATAALAGGAVLATKALYNIGETFDDVADTIRVGTGATGETLDGLIESAKTIGSEVPASFEDIGTTVADLNTRLGLTGPTLELLSKQFLEAGRITGEALDINAVTGAFSAFKIEGEDTTKAMDQLFRVSQATGVGMNELGQRMSKQGSILAQMGFGFEDTASFIGIMNKAGVDANAVVASMQAGLVRLAKDGEKPAAAFKRVTGEIQDFLKEGDEAAAIDLASKAFGTRGAGQMISALKSGKLNFEDMASAAGMSEDTILGVATETMDMAEQWQIFKNKALLAVEQIANRVFNLFGKGMEWMAKNGIPTLQSFGGWLQRNSAWLLPIATGITTIVAAIVIWTSVTKAFAAAQAALNIVLALNPITIVALALLGLVAGLVVAYKRSETFRNVVQSAFEMVRKVVGAVISWFGKYVPKVFKAVVGAVRAYINLYRTVIVTAFNVVKKVISTAMSVAKSVVTGTWRGITGTITGAVNGVVNLIRGVPGKIRALGGAFADAGRAIIDRFVQGLKNAAGIITGIAGNVWTTLKGLLNGAIDKVNAALEFKIDLPGPKDITINPPDIPHLARGTDYFRGGLAVVGEVGPELVNLPQGSQVIPNNEIARTLAGSGGGQRPIKVYDRSGDPVRTAREVARLEAWAGAA